MTSYHSPLQPDTYIPEFNLLFEKFLQKGGEAEIWKVRETGMMRRELAAKIILINKENRSSSEGIKRVRRMQDQEAKNWALLDRCEEIVQCHTSIETEVSISGKKYFMCGFTMPWAALGDLKKYLTDPRHLSFRGAKEKMLFLIQIAKAVKFAHDMGIAHQDVKPENVLLFQRGGEILPKLMDFGISIGGEDNSSAKGTPEYLAPERFDTGRTVTVFEAQRSDIYALGLLFVQFFTGSLPFEFPNVSEKEKWSAYHALHQTYEINEEKLSNQCGEQMTRLIVSMLAKSPSDRPNMFAVLNALEIGIRDARFKEAATIEQTNIIFADSYRWNPNIHASLGNSLFYFLLDCESQVSDIQWLISNFAQQKIHGYALYRVLGEYDYMIRVWLKGPYEAAIRTIFQQFESNLGGRVTTFATQRLYLFNKPASISLPQDKNALFQAIAECHHEDPSIELKNLKAKKFVTSMLMAKSKEKGIRFFVTLRSVNRIGSWKREMLATQFRDILLKLAKVRDVSAYEGDHDFCVLLKFRLAEFTDYQKVLDALLEGASEARKDNVNVSVQTHAEIASQFTRNSDDGSLVREVSATYIERHGVD